MWIYLSHILMKRLDDHKYIMPGLGDARWVVRHKVIALKYKNGVNYDKF